MTLAGRRILVLIIEVVIGDFGAGSIPVTEPFTKDQIFRQGTLRGYFISWYPS
jgi:hypothetical protein